MANSSYENYLKYQKCQAETTKKLKLIKRNNFKSFCESLSPFSPISLVWNKIRGFKNRFLDSPSPSSSSVNEEVLNSIKNYI